MTVPLTARVAFAALIVVSVVGCASLHSTPLTNDEAAAEGLIYYLPRRDVVVSVTVDAAGKISSIAAAPGPAYADLSKSYVLGFERSVFAKHEIDIAVSVDGLLTKTDATTTTTLAAALESVAETAGSIRMQGRTSQPCTTSGVHIFVLPVSPRQPTDRTALDTLHEVCGDQMEARVVEDLGTESAKASHEQTHESGTRVGVFYRQSRPYTVTVTPKTAGLHLTQTVLLPTRSPTRFLPMSRALFADASAKVGFKSGEPETLVQTAEGEGSELIKLPAKLLQAYFAAVGAVFTGRAGRDTSAAEAAAAEARLQSVRLQMALCRAAASAQPADPAVVQAACTIEGQ